MEIEHTSLFTDAKAIMASGKTTANVSWEIVVHYDNSEDAEVLVPIHLQSVNIIRDYVGDFADTVTVSMLMGLGDYAHLVYPNRVRLEVTLIQRQLQEGSGELDNSAPQISERFKAILIDTQQAPTIAQGQEHNSRHALNLTQVITVNFQLINKAVEQLRVQATGAIYRGVVPKDALTAIITNALGRVKVDDTRKILGVEVMDVDNLSKLEQLVIPHGTRVVDVPGIVQERYGVYNSGLGSYIQGSNWFVFPLYDTQVFNKRDATITLLIMPKRKFSNIERTFTVEDGSVTALVTGQTGFQDDSGTNTLNIGNGARFISADNLMETPVSTGGNKARISRKSNNREFVAEQDAPLNHVAFKDRRIASNPFPVYSELAAINGGMLRCVWQNSDASLVQPGMSAKIIYVDGDDVKSIYGIVHRVSHVSHNLGAIGEPRYKGNTMLDIFVNGQIELIDE